MRIAAILAAVWFSLSGCQEAILHELSEQDANRVIVALARSGLEGERVPEGSGWSVTVGSKDVAAALSAIEETRVLNRDTFSPAAPNSLFLSREERQAGLYQAVGTQLEGTLERFQGVVEARVHLHIDHSRRVAGESAKSGPSASVLLVAEARESIAIDEVRRVVAGATAIAEGNVIVVVTLRESKQGPATALVVPASKALEPVSDWKRINRHSINGWISANLQSMLGCTAVLLLLALFWMRLRATNAKSKLLHALKKSGAGGTNGDQQRSACYQAEFRAAQREYEFNGTNMGLGTGGGTLS